VKENFGKENKLCSKLVIDAVFATGHRLKQYPLYALVLETELPKKVSFQVLISVPKKKVKRAVERNFIKRLIREAFRKNKMELESFLEHTKKELAICFVYSSNEIPTFEFVQDKIDKLIIKLIEHETNPS
jgi:ribonuclease P protein component